jgi:hypothetical protein
LLLLAASSVNGVATCPSDDPDYLPSEGSETTNDSSSVASSGETRVSKGSKEEKRLVREFTIATMKKHPKIFMGVPEGMIFVVEEIATHVKGRYAIENVMLTLRKIKLMEPHSILALYFGISKSQVSKIFRKTLATVSACLNELIFYPDRQSTILNLPRAFRLNFFEATDVVDAFEIQIERPSDALHQMLSYSATRVATQ